jgi:hypothetical protein
LEPASGAPVGLIVAALVAKGELQPIAGRLQSGVLQRTLKAGLVATEKRQRIGPVRDQMRRDLPVAIDLEPHFDAAELRRIEADVEMIAAGERPTGNEDRDAGQGDGSEQVLRSGRSRRRGPSRCRLICRHPTLSSRRRCVGRSSRRAEQIVRRFACVRFRRKLERGPTGGAIKTGEIAGPAGSGISAAGRGTVIGAGVEEGITLCGKLGFFCSGPGDCPGAGALASSGESGFGGAISSRIAAKSGPFAFT